MITVIGRYPAPLEEWRPGVMTRMLVSSLVGARALCVFEQFVAPGTGAPSHVHSVEEVLAVLDGSAKLWLGDDQATLSKGEAVIVPAGILHGFQNTGAGTLHVHATLAAPWFEATFDGQAEARLWQGRD